VTVDVEVRGALPSDLDGQIHIAEDLATQGKPGARVLVDVLHRVKRGGLELFPRRSSVRHAAPADSD
jgi:hypothetical protein